MEQMTETRNYKSQEIVFLVLKGNDLTLSYILCFSVLLYPFNQASLHLKSEWVSAPWNQIIPLDHKNPRSLDLLV